MIIHSSSDRALLSEAEVLRTHGEKLLKQVVPNSIFDDGFIRVKDASLMTYHTRF